MDRSHARIALVVGAVLIGAVFVLANVLGESNPQASEVAVVPAASQNGAEPLIGPDVPAPEALPGAIAFALDGCARGWLDLSRAEILEPEGAPCEPAMPSDSSGPGPVEPPIALDELTALSSNQLARPVEIDGAELLGVVGYDVTEDGLAGVIVATSSAERLEQVLQLWRGGEFQHSIVLRSAAPRSIALVGDFGLTGRRVRLSPTGREIAISSGDRASRVTLIELATGRHRVLPERGRLDWSPDGRWLAIAMGDEILVYGTSRTAHVYALPVSAEAIEWRAEAAPATETP